MSRWNSGTRLRWKSKMHIEKVSTRWRSVLTRRREAAKRERTEQVEYRSGSLTSFAPPRATFPDLSGNISQCPRSLPEQPDFPQYFVPQHIILDGASWFDPICGFC